VNHLPQIKRVRCQTEIWPVAVIEQNLFLGRSVLRCREARNRLRRNFRTERPFSLAVSNRETASCDTVAGTCAGRPWALDLRPGAREELPTHRPNETVNVRALHRIHSLTESGACERAFCVRLVTKPTLCKLASEDARGGCDTKPCGLPFLFLLGAVAGNVLQDQGSAPLFPWGDSFVYPFLFVLFSVRAALALVRFQ